MRNIWVTGDYIIGPVGVTEIDCTGHFAVLEEVGLKSNHDHKVGFEGLLVTIQGGPYETGQVLIIGAGAVKREIVLSDWSLSETGQLICGGSNETH